MQHQFNAPTELPQQKVSWEKFYADKPLGRIFSGLRPSILPQISENIPMISQHQAIGKVLVFSGTSSYLKPVRQIFILETSSLGLEWKIYYFCSCWTTSLHYAGIECLCFVCLSFVLSNMTFFFWPVLKTVFLSLSFTCCFVTN